MAVQLRGLLRTGLVKLLRRLPLGAQLAIREDMNLLARLDYPAHEVRLFVESRIDYHVRARSCAKEPETVHWLESTLRPGDVLYDVGANVGAYSLVAAKFGQGEVKVFAFEPSFLNYYQLCRNVLVNGCGETVTAVPIAFAETTRLALFGYNSLLSGAASHSLVGQARETDQPRPEVEQPTLAYRLDDWIQQFRAPLPSHLKLDVDGAEVSILQGADLLLHNPRLRTLLIELTDSQVDSVTTLLANAGLRLQSKHPHSQVMNCIFARSER